MASFLQIRSNALKNLRSNTIPLRTAELDRQVQSHIDRTLLKFAHEGETDRLSLAHGFIKDERNETDGYGRPINCDNKPLAYAEHYLFARWFVAIGGTPISQKGRIINSPIIMILGVNNLTQRITYPYATKTILAAQ